MDEHHEGNDHCDEDESCCELSVLGYEAYEEDDCGEEEEDAIGVVSLYDAKDGKRILCHFCVPFEAFVRFGLKALEC